MAIENTISTYFWSAFVDCYARYAAYPVCSHNVANILFFEMLPSIKGFPSTIIIRIPKIINWRDFLLFIHQTDSEHNDL